MRIKPNAKHPISSPCDPQCQSKGGRRTIHATVYRFWHLAHTHRPTHTKARAHTHAPARTFHARATDLGDKTGRDFVAGEGGVLVGGHRAKIHHRINQALSRNAVQREWEKGSGCTVNGREAMKRESAKVGAHEVPTPQRPPKC